VLSSLVLGALVLAPGIPLALTIGRATRWSSVVAESLLLGVCWWLLLGLWFSHAGWFDPWQLALPTVVLVAALAVPAWRAARDVERPAFTWFAVAFAAVFVVAAYVRRDPSYFLFQIGDFGEYVNRANAVADGGGFIGWFTQGFTVALAMTHLVLGEARTVDLMPFLGLVLLAVTVELAARLGASPWARLAVAVILAVGVVPVWFSRFPASEMLYATLQVGMVLLLVDAVQRSSTKLAVAAGVVTGLLLVTRGNGILLGPIVVVVVAVCALVVSRRAMAVLTTFLAAAMAALGAGFVFNARFSHPYFIAEQLPKFVPDPLFDQLEGMGGLRFAVPRLLLLAAVTAGIVYGLRWLNTVVGPPRDSGVLRALRRAALPTFAVGCVLALLTVLDSAGLRDALARYDLVVEVLAVLGVGVAMWLFADRLDDAQRVGAALVIVTGGAFALLYAERLPRPRYAPYFLYWDRYLFSELFPLMVLAVIWAVWLVERTPLPKPAIGVGAVALGVLLHNDAGVIREQTFMDDAYEQLRAVDDLAADPDVPIVFAGITPADMPLALCHSNTHRIVASPLSSTFGRRFLNLGLAPYAPDPQPDAAAVEAALAGNDEAYLVQVAVGDEAPAPIAGLDARVAVELLGTTELAIPMLDRPLDHATPIEDDPLAGCARQGDARWSDPTFTIAVSHVTP
jgi:hypothetical protein